MFTEKDHHEFWEKIIDEIDLEALSQKEYSEIEDLIHEGISDATSDAAKLIFEKLTSDLSNKLELGRIIDEDFEKRLYDLWQQPLDLLELFLAISFEAGSTFNQERLPVAVQENDFVFEVLCRLHARACLIGGEILTLMKGGYASGALSRWRSLHEISIICFFIREYGNEVAERYILYQGIDSYLSMKKYQIYASRLGYEPYSEEEVKNITENRDRLIKKYGDDFGQQNGWAASIIKKKFIKITDLEKEIGLDHYRPYYQMSSYSIHAGSMSVYFDIGVPNSDEIMLAGPSNTGLADPGSLMAISLHQITVNLLNSKLTINGLICMKTMELFVEKIKLEFGNVDMYTKSKINHR